MFFLATVFNFIYYSVYRLLKWIILDDELEGVWKEATAVVYFNKPSQNLHGMTEESHRNLS